MDVKCPIYDRVCKDFTEEKCMKCQLRGMFNNAYSLIVSNLRITDVTKGVADYKVKGCVKNKEWTKQKLKELKVIETELMKLN